MARESAQRKEDRYEERGSPLQTTSPASSSRSGVNGVVQHTTIGPLRNGVNGVVGGRGTAARYAPTRETYRERERKDADWQVPMALQQSVVSSSALIHLATTMTTCIQAERLGLFRRGCSLSSIASGSIGHSQGIASACGLVSSIRNLRKERGDRHCLSVVRLLFEQGLFEQLNTGLRHFRSDERGLRSGMLMIRGNAHHMLRRYKGVGSVVGNVSIINAERSVVCSGEFALDMLRKESVYEGLELRALPITVPFHCRSLEPSLFDLNYSVREQGGSRGRRCADWPVFSASSCGFHGKLELEMREVVAASQLSFNMDFPLGFERAATSQKDPEIIDFGPCEDAVAFRLVDQVLSDVDVVSAVGRKPRRQTDIDIVAPQTDVAKISEQIKELCTEVLGSRASSSDTPLIEAGLTSQSVASLRSRLIDAFPHFASLVSMKVFFDYPTIKALAEYLLASCESTSSTAETVELAPGVLLPIERITVYITQGSTYPLSYGQEQMLSMQVTNPMMTAYNVSSSMWICGGLDPDKLRYCLRAVISRHEVFLCTAAPSPPVARMRTVMPPVPIVHVEDEASALGRMSQVGRVPFNLLQESSLRVEVLVTPSGLILLNLWVHHMNFDILSQGCFLRELYLLLCSSGTEAAGLPDLPVQYMDYAYWSRQAAKQGHYDVTPLVKELLPHADLVLDLPTDFPRPKRWSFLGDRVTTTLESELVFPHAGITPFIAFLTAFFVQLSKASGSEPVIMGVPYHGRDQACLEPLCGYFINMVPVVNVVRHGTPVLHALANARDSWLRAAESSHVPFLYLMEKLKKDHGFRQDPSRNPIFQAMLNYRRDSTKALYDRRFLAQPVHHVEAHMDFDLQIDQVGTRQTVITHNYCTSLFLPRTAEIFAAQYMAIVRCLSSPRWTMVDVHRLPSNIDSVEEVESAPILSPETQCTLIEPMLQQLGVGSWTPVLVVERDLSGGIIVKAC